jgi:multidrug efflux pump subunit AcrB
MTGLGISGRVARFFLSSQLTPLIAIPAEQVLSQIPGLEHVWLVSRPGQAPITVQHKAGVPRTEAIVRLHDTILSHRDWLPPELNIGDPLVKPKGVDDVPIVALTLWTRGPHARRVRPGARCARGRGGIEARARHA